MLQSGGSCFLGSSRVMMADEQTRPIEEVKVGDSLLGLDGQKHRVSIWRGRAFDPGMRI